MAVDDQSRGFGSARFGRRGSAAEFQRLAEAEASSPSWPEVPSPAGSLKPSAS